MVDLQDRAEPNPYATKIMVAVGVGVVEIMMLLYVSYIYCARGFRQIPMAARQIGQFVGNFGR